MDCRPLCGACCTAPSISSPIPGLTAIDGIYKPAGVACIQLDQDQRCKLFGLPTRPAVCASLQPSADMCGTHRQQAIAWLGQLEAATRPQPA